ncbi:MAG: hypothetical protein H3C41_09660 [Bacteroidales bacterium]|nr:hypothetical protein [Bacteroidales bacterium]
MREEYDIMINEAYDIAIESGDFVIGENLNQQVVCLLAANKGDYKQAPGMGVGLDNYLLDDEDQTAMNREFRVQAAKEGLRVNSFQMRNGQLYLDVKRQNEQP